MEIIITNSSIGKRRCRKGKIIFRPFQNQKHRRKIWHLPAMAGHIALKCIPAQKQRFFLKTARTLRWTETMTVFHARSSGANSAEDGFGEI